MRIGAIAVFLALTASATIALRKSPPNMSDYDAIQGLWRLKSRTSRGQPVGDSATHYLFAGQTMKEIVPSLVDDGKLRTTFELDESARPKRITQTLDYNGPDGPPDPNPIILHYLYRIEGDTLVFCTGPHGQFPEKISDEYGIVTLERDRGPMPERRKPSGKKPLRDDLLGELPWEDNFNWYSGELELGGTKITVTLNPDDEGAVTASVARAKQIVSRFEYYRSLVADFAVAELLELKNDTWLDEGEPKVTAANFKSKLVLESFTAYANGRVEFWHYDGQLFLGHSIEVTLDENDKCLSANIAG